MFFKRTMPESAFAVLAVPLAPVPFFVFAVEQDAAVRKNAFGPGAAEVNFGP